jgi:hypothetical protein
MGTASALTEEPEYCSPAEAAKILEEFGLKPSPGSTAEGGRGNG